MAEGVFNVGGAISGDGGNVEVDGGNFFAGSIAGSNTYSLSLNGTLEIAAAISSGIPSPLRIVAPTHYSSTIRGPP